MNQVQTSTPKAVANVRTFSANPRVQGAGVAIFGQATASMVGSTVGKSDMFYRPDIFMLANAAGSIKAAIDDWRYWRKLKTDGHRGAARVAGLAVVLDVLNIIPSSHPFLRTISGRANDTKYWGACISASIVILFYSNKLVAFARELELQDKYRENSISPQEKQEFAAIIANQFVGLNLKMERLVARGKENSRKGQKMAFEIKVNSELLDSLTFPVPG